MMGVLAMNEYADIGFIILALTANGETEHLTWRNLDHVIRLRIEESEWRMARLINTAMDEILEGIRT